MSWNDVVIGAGERLNSAVKCFSHGDVWVSENRSAYWCSRVYHGLGMTVYKDTPEGKALYDHMQSTVWPKTTMDGQNTVVSYLESLLTSNLTAEQWKEVVVKETARAYKRGMQACQENVREALGL